MVLPGKLCIGTLEEDNPQKSYFRFRPLILLTEDGYRAFEAVEEYPEDGCIRIVPDKNESSHFKARMRRIGKYAQLDLREHSGENDKIRPNKNYRVDLLEKNANIVYSDVVVDLEDGALMEVLDLPVKEDASHLALQIPMPQSAKVLVRTEQGILPWTWKAEVMEGVENGVSLVRLEEEVDLEDAREFIEPQGAHILLAAPGKTLLKVRPVYPENAPMISQPPAVSPPVEESARISQREQALLQQTGLNPRRGRSLQEIIEDKWRHSRIDQLGHPIPASATGKPVVSPIERAVESVKSVWGLPEARQAMVEEFSKLEGLSGEIRKQVDLRAEREAADRLNELEAHRLKLINEVRDLQTGRREAREELLREIRRTNAQEIGEGERELRALREEADACRRQIEQYEGALRVAQSSLENLLGDNFAQKIIEHALTREATAILRRMDATPSLPEHARTITPTAGELLSDVRRFFAASGRKIFNDDAVNLLTCFTLSPVTILSGPTGCGKTMTVRLLSEALGLTKWNRFSRLRPLRRPGEENAQLRAFAESPGHEAPLMLLLDDANLLPDDRLAQAAIATLEDESANPCMRLWMTVQDSQQGFPLRAQLLDRAFLLRLEMDQFDWEPLGQMPDSPELAVSSQALENIFCPRPEAIDEEVRLRMNALRKDLNRLGVSVSRRTLDALWNYCAAATPLMREHTPLEVLDWGVAQRVLPVVLCCAPLSALIELKDLLKDMPRCRELLKEPLPVEV